MSKFLKNLVSSKIVMALLSVVLGVILLIMQGGALTLIVKATAIVCIVAGVGYAILFLLNKNRSNTMLACSIIVLILGVLFLIRPDIIVNFFPVILGVYLIIEGLTNLLASLQHKKSKGFLIGLILAILTIVVGVYLIFRAGTVMNIVVIIAGISLIVNGLTDLFALKAFK